MLKKILSDMELTDDECSIVVYGLRRLVIPSDYIRCSVYESC